MNRHIAPPINLINSLTLPKVDKINLDNGVPVYQINEGDQDVVKVELLYNAGKWYEEKNLVADLTNRLLREGTVNKNAQQIADAFDYYGANFNSSAGYETAGASLFSLNKHINTLLPFLFEIFSEPVFPEHELATVITNRKQRLAVELKKNDFVANRQFVQALFGAKHPYGRITKPENFENVSAEDLKSFFQKHYEPGQLIILVSGKFDHSVITQLNKTFGSCKVSSPTGHIGPAYPIEPAAHLVQHTEKTDSVQSAVLLGNVTINKAHPDFQKLSVLNTVFGGYFGSRLMRNIREEKGYTYGIHSNFVSYPHAGFFEISSEVGKQVREATLSEIEKEMKELRTTPIPEDELQVVKNYMSGRILRSIDGPMKFSDSLKNLLIYKQDVDYIHQFLKTVREVRTEDLLDLANKYLDYEKMYKITVG